MITHLNIFLSFSPPPPLPPQILGKVGRVVDVYSDGDLQVEIAGTKWTFNPKNVTRLEGDGAPLTPDTSGEWRVEANNRMTPVS